MYTPNSIKIRLYNCIHVHVYSVHKSWKKLHVHVHVVLMNSITSTVHKDSYMYFLHVHASSCSSIHTHMYVHLCMAVCTTHFIDGIVCTCICTLCILNSLTFASLHNYKISLLTSDFAVFTSAPAPNKLCTTS